jgi:Fe-Mn family superoxide dismutase
MRFRLPPLPYDYAALEPYLSSDTLRFHHDKHHQTYVETLNKLIAGTKFETLPLEEIIRATARSDEHRKIFNNAAQVWNHTVQWNCMRAGGGGAPPKDIGKQIDRAIGSFYEIKQ